MIKEIKISEEELESNFQHWVKSFDTEKVPDPDLKELVNLVFPTHTFGHIKTINGVPTFPHKKIFGIDEDPQGLLSDAYRLENRLFKASEQRRTMSSARVVGLDSYVFAYLSIHDPYYGRPSDTDIDINHRPFGIFLQKDVEMLPNCLPTRRDVNIYNGSNPTVEDLRKEFLNPLKTREYLGFEIANDEEHKGDFWHYYGKPSLLAMEDYYTSAWTKRIEYHYFEKILPEKFIAILWPIWQRNAVNPGILDWDESYYNIPKINTNFPNVKIITYEWDVADPEMCFLEASYYSTLYYNKYNIFPESAELAKKEFE